MYTDIQRGDIVAVKYIPEHREDNVAQVVGPHKYLPNEVEIFPSINGSVFWHVDDLVIINRPSE